MQKGEMKEFILDGKSYLLVKRMDEGFSLWDEDSKVEPYHVVPARKSCTCEHHRIRKVVCKHIIALSNI
jgi:hypothetical protein